MPLEQLIYMSCAAEELSDEALNDILESSVEHNARQGVTGMLLYFDGYFMQAIEGERAATAETYDRICKDSRHRRIYLLSRESIAEREFPTWNMGFRRLSMSDVAIHPAYAEVLRKGFDPAEIGSRSGLAVNMLRQFSKL